MPRDIRQFTVNGHAFDEAIRHEENEITRRLLIAVRFYLFRHLYHDRYAPPAYPVDVAFFMDVMHDFFEGHNDIRDILAGKEINSFEAD